MEPVSALGLAANIFQFISFGDELLTSVKDICFSASGTTEKVEHLNFLVADIQHRSKDAVSLACSSVDQDLQSLCKIALGSQILADALLKKLSKLDAKRMGVTRMLEAFAIARRSAWDKNEIHDMTVRLFELTARLILWWESETQR